MSSQVIRKVEVVCSTCGEIYYRVVETEYLDSPHIWKRVGYPVIICEDCRKDIYKFKQEDYFDGNRVST